MVFAEILFSSPSFFFTSAKTGDAKKLGDDKCLGRGEKGEEDER